MAVAQGTGANRNWSMETIKLRAVAARTKGDLVKIGTGHSSGTFSDVTIVSDTTLYRVAVALENAAVNDVYEACYRGTVDLTVPSATYTAGNGLRVTTGAIADSAGAANAYDDLPANRDFAVIAVGGTTVTTVTATLTGDRITAA